MFNTTPSAKWEYHERLKIIAMLVWKLRTQAGLLSDENAVNETLEKIDFLSGKPSDWLENNRAQIMEGL